MNDMMQTETALTVISPSAVSTIVANGGGDILSVIAAKVAAFQSERSNSPRLEERRSLAAEISKTKVALVKLGKSLTVQWREQTKAVNDECNLVEDRMEELRTLIRQPLTDWENAEKQRIADHQAALAAVDCWPVLDSPMTAAQLAKHIAGIEASELTRRDWQEFAGPAQNAIEHAMNTLRKMHAGLVKQETEAAELAAFRAAEAQRQAEETERQRIEREAQIAKDASEAARVAAERVAAEQAAKVERDRIAAEKAASDAIAAATERAAQAERDRVAEAARAEAARLKAIEGARIAQAKALADAEAARVADANRIAAEEATRSADRAHRGTIMGAAKDALMAHAGLTEEQAKAVVKSIVAGLVPDVVVRF